ncbi:MAG: SDR family NAD(P)-dependent oxidoreductase, partial [Desulfobulbales bacterium]|nr:SDR family NAD(P)-dependent oxidoreductase [Desulfobulbales bacterium]
MVAFHSAGVMSAEELLGFAALRGRAMTSRSQNGTGAMASFACDRKTLEDLIRDVDGYGVVANINSPLQTVLSGESAAVEQAMSFAAHRDIKTKRLPVANAFHSRFVTDAAEQLRNKANIPEVLKKNGVKLFSSIDGSEVRADTNLREHFARQVTAQVDFISLVENMKARCDLLLEVGPGRILTGLVQTITGPAGIPCFPVEAKASEWRSLNIFLGAYFAHGGDIQWPALYENRLVRQFIPAAERIFIDNPCERSFAWEEDPDLPGYTDYTLGHSVILPGNTLGLFSSQQEDFIRNLIRSEMKNNQDGHSPSPEQLTSGTIYPVAALPQDVREKASRKGGNKKKSPDILVELAAEATGFAPESIALDNRLLDNLNLDSIKAGQFVAKAVKLFGVEGKLDPTTMANSSLQEIYEAIAGVLPPEAANEQEPDLPLAEPGLLLELAAEITGFPVESISLEKRLLDDLNLDSIKAGQFVAKAAKLYEVEGKLDPTTMANSSIQEVFDMIVEHLPAADISSSKPSRHVSGNQQESFSLPAADVNDNWVRNFRINYVVHELTSPSSEAHIISRLGAGNKGVVIFSDDSEDELTRDIMAVLTGHNIRVESKKYEHINAMSREDLATFSTCIYLLPIQYGNEFFSAGQAKNMTQRLHRIGSFISGLKGDASETAHTVVQFGNGEVFNTCRDDNISLAAKGCAAFFSSMHLDNPDEKIRVLEFSSRITATNLLNRIADELATEEKFGIAGYDREDKRLVPMLEPADSQSFTARKIIRTSDDVILVTGGAKGITAECALSFARQTGVKLALVGRTPLLNNNQEIQEVLGRYRANNITYRYYACDISDETSVRDLVKRIEQDLGSVTGVVHGAAVNKPRRVEQASFASVL